MIREATIQDIPDLVKIHMAALPHDLLPSLGKNFLQEYFYPIVINSKEALTLVNQAENVIDSFVIFAFQSDKLTSLIMQNKIILARFVLTKILKDFSIINEILGRLLGFKEDLDVGLDIKIEKLPELYLIATNPNNQSTGIGSSLVNMGLLRLNEMGKNFCLVKTSSERARLFYLKLNFKDIGREYRLKRGLYLLLYSKPK